MARPDGDAGPLRQEAPIAVMDADCALCSFGARMIHRMDRTGRVRICAVQSDLGRTLLSVHGLSGLDPASWLYLSDGHAWEGFEAMAVFGRDAGGWGRLLGALCLIPGSLRRWLYARIARNRYRLFGRSSYCAIPDPAFRARLIGRLPE